VSFDRPISADQLISTSIGAGDGGQGRGKCPTNSEKKIFFSGIILAIFGANIIKFGIF